MKKLADFEPLRPAEAELVKELQKGNRKTIKISGGVPDDKDKTLKLRATFLRYLALGGCKKCRLPEAGLRVMGAFIDGDEENSEFTKGLDLEGATLLHDLALFDCHIAEPIILRSAKIKNLFLNRSHVKAIRADRLQAEGDVTLRGATIKGEVRLLGARLGGNLSCDGSNLKDEKTALRCDGMQAEGSVFLRKVTIAGEVRLLGARLGGDLSFIGATLQAKGEALRCDGMRAEGNVFLSRATIAGEVRLRGARLGGDLACVGAKLQAKGKALNCDGAEVRGAFFWREGAKATGWIDLTAACFGAINDDPACWPPEVILDRCRYGAFLGRSPTDAKHRLKWLALQQPRKYGHDFWPDPYEHCAKVLREMGHGEDAREILIEKERLQRKAQRQRLKRAYLFEDYYLAALADRILGATVAYGRKPLRAAVWLLLPYFIGVWIFGTAFARDEIKPNLPQIQRAPEWVLCGVDADEEITLTGQDTPTPGLREKGQGRLACFHDTAEGRNHPRFNPYIYSADTLLPIVSMEMQSYWIPDDSTPFGGFARFYLWVHIAAGWALTLLAVAGFSGLIKTDNTK